MKPLAWLGAGLLGLTAAGLALHATAPFGIGWPGNKPAFVALLGVALLAYFASVRVVLRARHASAMLVVVGVAVGLRVLALCGPAFLSTDVNRYVWDGRVQAAGINPYLYVPADPALAGLRDDAVYPQINRGDYAPTIYPPMAQLVFAAIVRIADGVLAMKLAMVAFEALAVLCLWRLLAQARLPPERLLVYAWNPLAVWAFAGNGHVDAIAIFLLAAALLLRARLRDGAAGLLLGAAILVKFLPLAVVPALLRRGGFVRLAAGCVAAMVLLYALYAGAGWRVLGFLPGYGSEEGLEDGSGIWLLAGLGSLVSLPAAAPLVYFALSALGLVGLAAWIALRARAAPGTPADVVTLCGDAALLAACLTVAISPHYPWYFAWLAMPAVIRPWRSVVWLSAAPALLYLDNSAGRFLWPAVVYVPAALLAAADLWGRKPQAAQGYVMEGSP